MGRNTCFNPKHTASHLECRTSLTPGSGSNRDSIQETGIPFLLRSGECMCQVAKDTRTNLKLSRTQADIRSSWPGQSVALHLVTSVPASAISVGLFSQTQHFHIQAHHHCPGLRESSQPVSLPRECGPLPRQRQT